MLKGGKEAQYSNEIIAKVFKSVLVKNNLQQEIISHYYQMQQEKVYQNLIKMDKYVDLIVPRGGEALNKIYF